MLAIVSSYRFSDWFKKASPSLLRLLLLWTIYNGQHPHIPKGIPQESTLAPIPVIQSLALIIWNNYTLWLKARLEVTKRTVKPSLLKHPSKSCYIYKSSEGSYFVNGKVLWKSKCVKELVCGDLLLLISTYKRIRICALTSFFSSRNCAN